jgi:hypothetical protein
MIECHIDPSKGLCSPREDNRAEAPMLVSRRVVTFLGHGEFGNADAAATAPRLGMSGPYAGLRNNCKTCLPGSHRD